MNGKAACLVLVLTLGATGPVQATSYQDLWWNAAEPGWGVNILHQGDVLVATWFIYDADGKPLWLLGVPVRSGAASFDGEVYRYTGPGYNLATFDSKTVTETAVGTAQFRFSDFGSGTVTYTVNGNAVTKQITRQTYEWPKLDGTYFDAALRSWSGCNDASQNGAFYSNRIYRFARSAESLRLGYGTLDSNNAYLEQCTATGAPVVRGSGVDMSAPFTCTSGAAGTVTLSELRVVDAGFLGTITWSFGAASPAYAGCTVVGTTGAGRY